MNDYYRIGRGEEYLEVSIDWENPNYVKIVYWLKEALGDDYNQEELKKALLEVANSIPIKEE